MGVDVYNLLGFGIEVDGKYKIYDSEDADYYEDEEPADIWTADLKKFGLKYYWSEGSEYIGIFEMSDAYRDSFSISYTYEQFATKLKEAEIAFAKLAEVNPIFEDKVVKFYATTLYH